MKKNDFEYLLNVLKKYAGWDFNEDNYYIIDKKVANFIREKGYNNIDELMAEVRLGTKSIIIPLVENIAYSDTHFYKDHEVFYRFENITLPYLREKNRAAKKLKIWSIGCSTGQETYSISIAIKNKLLNVKDWDINILGTDLSTASINKAQKGSYTNLEVQMGFNIKTIINNFERQQGDWKINREHMDLIKFRRYNLLDNIIDESDYDIIFCRNVLSIFTEEEKLKIIQKIYLNQSENGLLYLGKNELINGIEQFYIKVPGFNCLYQAKNSSNNEIKIYNNTIYKADEDEIPSFNHK